jgi:hypothetical protein
VGSNGVTNVIGSPERSNVSLLVQVPVVIVDDPIDTVHYAGGNITLSCNASGIPIPTFKWFKNNQLITTNERIDNSTTTHILNDTYSLIESTLALRELILSDDANYHCQATNPGAHSTIFTVSSSTVHLTVQYPPNVTTEEPIEVIVNQTQEAIFNCTAYGIPAPNITWIKVSDGLMLDDSIKDIQITTSLISSTVRHSMLRFISTLKTDESFYTCVGSNGVTNVIGSPERSNVSLLVQVPVVIVDDPIDTVHYAGGNITLSCNASGIPIPTFKWFKNNQLITTNERIDNSTTTHILNDTYSLIESTLALRELILSDDANYHCQATNPGAHSTIFTVLSSTAHLTVQHPPNVTVTPDQIIVNSTVPSFEFTCYAFGIPTPSITWLKERTNTTITSQGGTQIVETTTDSSITSILTLYEPDDLDESNYTCLASNSITNVLGTPESDTGEVYIQDPVRIVSGPSGRVLPAGTSVVDLKCTAFGFPLPSIYWYKDGMLVIPDGNHLRITNTTFISDTFGFHQSQFQLVDLTLNDDADYTCVAINTGAPGIIFNVSSGPVHITVQYPPLVTVTPSTLTVNQSDTVVFTCSIFGIPTPTFVWINNTDSTPLSSISGSLIITNTTVGNNITSNMTILSALRTDMGTYICSAQNNINNLVDAPDQDSVQLFVQEPSIFIISPSNVTNHTAGLAVMTCVATGIPQPVITWFKDGSPIVADTKRNVDIVSSITQNEINVTSTLTIRDLVLSDTGYYSCSSSNLQADESLSFVDSSGSAFLFVQYPPEVSLIPTLTVTNQTNTTSFTCSLFGVPTPDITWYKIQDGLTTKLDGSTFNITTVIDNYNITSVLYFNSSLRTDEGNYTCVGENNVTNIINSPESDLASLFVQVPPLFILHPISVTNYTAGQVVLTCSVSGLPVPTITWLKDGAVVTENDNISITNALSSSSNTGMSTSSLTLTQLTLDDVAMYNCMANNTGAFDNQFTVYSLSSLLTVEYPPSVTISPVIMTVNQTDTVAITCEVFATPRPDITWTDVRNNSVITPLDGVISIQETTPSDNVVVSILTFVSINKFNESNYTCTAVNNITNIIGSPEKATSSLTVQVLATITSLVGLTLHRESGSNATLSFDLSDDFPLVLTSNIRWFFRSVSTIQDITFTTDQRITISDDRLTLVIDGITETDEGQYILSATNEAGTSQGFIVIVVVGRPAILTVPIDQQHIEGETAKFNCFATGDPIPQVTWKFNGTAILTNNTKYYIGLITDAADFGSLTISDVTYFDKGVYTCIATNINGTSSVEASLSVQVVPVVTVSPVTQAGIAGGVVTLNCSAYGAPSIDIAWLKNGVVVDQQLIPDGTISVTRGILPVDITVSSSLTITNLQLHDIANYTCNVTNQLVEFRSALSNESLLTVLYPPNVAVSPDTFILNQTETTNFTCVAFGIPLPKLTWYNTENITEELADGIIVEERSFINESGLELTESVLIFQSALRTDTSSYICIGENGIDNLLKTPENGTVALYVQVPVAIDSSPVDNVVHFRGGETNITCSFTGLPLPQVKWIKNGNVLNLSDRIYVIESNQSNDTYGLVVSTLVFSRLELTDNATYHCIANNTGAPGNEFVVESDSSFIFITHPPNVTLSPSVELTVNVTFTATLTCTVFAIPLPAITWLKASDGSIVEATDRVTLTTIDSIHVRTSILNFTATNKSDESEYTCIAVNDITNVIDTPENQTINLIIQVPAAVRLVTSSPHNGVEGQDTTLSFIIANDDPLVNSSNIRWEFTNAHDITDITHSTDPHYQLSSDRLSLTIIQLTSAHQGIYTLFATNQAGTRSNSIILNIQVSPLIVLFPRDSIQLENTSVTFQCLGTGDPFPSVTWSFDNEPLNDTRHTIGDKGTLFGSLTITDIIYNDRGLYVCSYSNSHGSIKASARLTVQVAPVIKAITVPANGTAGDDVLMTCVATGFPAPAIRWLINGTSAETVTSKVRVSSETLENEEEQFDVTSRLTLSGLVLDDTNLYSCEAENLLASREIVVSNQSRLNVLYPPDVTASLSDLTINQTDEASFNCTIFSLPQSIIQWSLNGINLQNDNIKEVTVINGSGLTLLISTLTIPYAIRSTHEGVYTCNASNGIANLINSPEFQSIRLTVQVPPTVVVITTSPLGVVDKSVTITFGIIDASPTVNASNIWWTFNGSIVANTSRHRLSVDLLSLTINDLTHSDQGYYTLTATNEAGTNSSSVYLEIEAAPVIVTPPTNMSKLEGDKVTFMCSATSEPTHAVRWSFNSSLLPNDTVKYRVSPSDDPLYGALTVFNVNMNDAGLYTCSVDNIHGNDSSSAYLSVQVIPQFLEEPVNNTKLVGDNVTMSCSAYGIPVPSITWLKDGVPITDPSSVTSISGRISSTRLLLASLNFSDVAGYSCIASNNLVSLQTTNSSTATLTIHMPVIITGSPMNDTVNETDTVSYTCAARGLPSPSFMWSASDGRDLTSRDDISINTTMTSQLIGPTQTISVLTFNSIRDSDATQYTCTAYNVPANISTVTVSSSFSIVVQTRPVVQFVNVIDPVIGVEFQDVQLTINITRDLPSVVTSDIQWFYSNNGQRLALASDDHYHISGNRLSLVISNLSLSDSGLYTAEASNIVGTGSSSITLNVQKAPVIISPLRPLTQLAGTNAVFTCIAIAIPQHTTEWLKDGQPLTNSSKHSITGLGTSTSTLTIIDIELSDRGNYTCIADNLHGNDTTTDQLFVQVPPAYSIFPESRPSLVASDNTSITCNVTGFPQPSVDILKDGAPLVGASPARTQGVHPDGSYYSSVSISLSSLTYNDTANYSCIANNSLANVQTNTSPPALFVVQYPPDVSVTPTSITVNETDTVSFYCTVFGIPPPNIVWINAADMNQQLSDHIDNSLVIVYTSSYHPSGTPFNTSNLTIISANKQHETNYTCIAANGVPNFINTPTNGSVSLTVQVPPTVTPLKVELLGIVNDSVTLSFVIERASPPVDLNDISWTFTDVKGNISFITPTNRSYFSFDSLNLTLNDLQHSDEGVYTLTAGNPAGVHAASINLSIEAPPVFTQKPRDASRLRGETATFNCSAIAEPVHSIRWEREGETIAESLSTQDGQEFIDSFTRLNTTERGQNTTIDKAKYMLEGEGSPLYGQLTIFNTNLNDVGDYTCILANTHGTIMASANLSVQVTPSFTVEFPSPVQNASAGQNVSYSCKAIGLPEPMIVWYFNGELLNETNDGNIVIENTVSEQMTENVLTIRKITLENTGVYWCNASNFRFVFFEVSSPKWTVNVYYPANVMSITPASLQRNATQYASLICEVSGLPPPIVTWTSSSSNGEITNTLGKYTITTSTKYTSDTGPTVVESNLLILNLTATDERLYTCTGSHLFFIDNFIGADNSSSSSLQVRVSPRVVGVTRSGVVQWNTSHTITFTVTVSQPVIVPSDIIWEFTDSTGTRAIIANGGRYIFSQDRKSLTISPVRLRDKGSYRMIASNVAGRATDVISIEQVYAVPYIGEANETIRVNVGESVTFNCTADGVPQPTLTWFNNEALITRGGTPRWLITDSLLTGSRVRDDLESVHSVMSQLTLRDVDAYDNGYVISCQANDGLGNTVSVSYTLQVDGINNHCSSNPCQNGGTCHVTRDSFQCLCANSFIGPTCEENESPISLSPRLTTSPQPVAVPLYSSVSLTCIAMGIPTPYITWYKDDTRISGAFGNVYYIPQLTVEQRGMYYCNATGSGVTLSIPVLVTISNVAQYLLTASSNLTRHLLDTNIIGKTFQNATATVFAIEHFLFGRSNTTLLVTVVSGNITGSLQYQLIDLLDNQIGSSSQSTIGIKRFDGCISETTNGTFHWPEIGVGTDYSINCSCGDLSLGKGRPVARRSCRGDFIRGGTWGTPDVDECNFDDQSLLLCNATQVTRMPDNE